jgi:hypothetical protein
MGLTWLAQHASVVPSKKSKAGAVHSPILNVSRFTCHLLNDWHILRRKFVDEGRLAVTIDRRGLRLGPSATVSVWKVECFRCS